MAVAIDVLCVRPPLKEPETPLPDGVAKDHPVGTVYDVDAEAIERGREVAKRAQSATQRLILFDTNSKQSWNLHDAENDRNSYVNPVGAALAEGFKIKQVTPVNDRHLIFVFEKGIK